MNTNPLGATDSSACFSESQRTALLTLLADEDPRVYQTIRKKILAEGPAAMKWLRPHARSRDPALRRRANEIILHFERQAADTRFLGFCLKNGEEFDLEHCAWLLAQTRYPQINPEAYSALIDEFAGQLRGRLDMTAGAKSVLAVINQFLFEKLGFIGNQEDFYDPENSYLNRVLDRRKGNPISLCLLYMLIGRRLRLPMAGIGLPGHFICRYQCASGEVYLDAFHKGKFLTKADCIHYLLHANLSVRDDYLAPVTPRRLMLRVCANLHQIYVMRELETEATRVQRYVVALGR